MLFNSLEFVLVFLPITLFGYYGLIRLGLERHVLRYLVVASLVFYSVWNPPYVALLLISVGANYLFGNWIERVRSRDENATAFPLWTGIGANLALLGYYKYANFFVDTVNSVAPTNLHLESIVLPLAISFYTFQQIAYLVDVARDEVRPGNLARYTTFVVFFPQLVAGPIVHYRDMIPQFFGGGLGRFRGANLTVGTVIFAIGLAKKTVIADTAALYSTPVFDAAQAGAAIGLLEAWRAATAYTIQLYFDFSGYSDMAIGLARMFGIRLPVNFHSPLRAASIIDYWRRWHITLQQFIVVYMYQPIVLPLARLSATWGLRRWGTFTVATAIPTVVIFVVIGLWHGAGWTFVLFGLMHGTYLATNEWWRELRRKARRRDKTPPGFRALAGYHVLTFAAVLVANVMFRAESPAAAMAVYAGMLDFGDGLSGLPGSVAEVIVGPIPFLLASYLIVFLAPNTQQIMGRYRPVLEWSRWRDVAEPRWKLHWRPTAGWAFATGVVLFAGLSFIMRGQTEFIYFNF